MEGINQDIYSPDFHTRAYQPGDELYINQLYHRITGTTRSVEEYKWEWVDTWDGVGTAYLMFDNNRPKEDQLVCQYSLIPVPFVFFGQEISCGKTENCMSHPDYRGKGVFFPHEKKFFEEAKKRYQLFFTTTGKGAPGKVRRKVGYKALDYWVEFFYIPKFSTLRKYIWFNYFRKIDKSNSTLSILLRFISTLTSALLWLYFSLKSHGVVHKEGQIRNFTEANAPLSNIQQLWEKHKADYGITIGRSSEFLKWRINDNPYFEHRYLCLYDDGKLIGYAIYHIDKRNKIKVVDLFVANQDGKVLRRLFKALVHIMKQGNHLGIVCGALKGNQLLEDSFKTSKFLKKDFSTIQNRFSKKPLEKPFYVFAMEHLPEHERAYVPENWYVTDIVKEGIQ